jgi:hypothetical protein
VKRILLFLSYLMAGVMTICAQTVKIQAPEVCEVGRRVNVSYVVDTQDVEDIRVGNFPGFELLYGPSTSSQSSFQMINGKTTHSSTITFTYVLLAKEEGEFTLPKADVVLGGKTIRSNSTTIRCSPPRRGTREAALPRNRAASPIATLMSRMEASATGTFSFLPQ